MRQGFEEKRLPVSTREIRVGFGAEQFFDGVGSMHGDRKEQWSEPGVRRQLGASPDPNTPAYGGIGIGIGVGLGGLPPPPPPPPPLPLLPEGITVALVVVVAVESARADAVKTISKKTAQLKFQKLFGNILVLKN